MSRYDFNERFLSDLRSAIDIVEVISDTVTLKKAGRTWKGLCPFHGEKSASFNVDREKGFYHCFGCGVGGDALRFVIETEKIEFPEACERLARRFHVPIPERSSPTFDKEKQKFDRLREVILRTQGLFREELRRPGNPSRPYLDSRGLSPETIDEFAFGHAPDSWDFVTGRLAREFGEATLEEAGVVIRNQEKGSFYDRFRNRVMVPITDREGRFVAFGGRSLDGKDPKYLNSPESPIFQKSKLLFNFYRARGEIRRRESAILVEGYFDAITLAAGGVPNVVASLGTSFTEGHAEILRRLTPRVVICYDGDSAGQSAAARALPILLAADLDVRVTTLPPGEDPDTFLRTKGLDTLERALAGAAEPVDFLLRREPDLTSASGRRGAADRVLEILKANPNRVWRFGAVEQLAGRLGLPSNLLWDRVGERRPSPSTSASPAPAAVAGGDPRIVTGERRLLHLLVGSPELRKRAASTLEPADLLLASHQEILGLVCSADFFDQALDFRDLIPHLKSDAAMAALSSIALGSGPDPQPGEFEELVTIVQRRSLDRRGETLQGEIHRLVSSGEDPERIDSLLKAKVELKRRAGRLGRPLPAGGSGEAPPKSNP
jgi:DNA primase